MDIRLWKRSNENTPVVDELSNMDKYHEGLAIDELESLKLESEEKLRKTGDLKKLRSEDGLHRLVGDIPDKAIRYLGVMHREALWLLTMAVKKEGLKKGDFIRARDRHDAFKRQNPKKHYNG